MTDTRPGAHVLDLPQWAFYVRVGQVVFALIVLGLSAGAESYLGTGGLGFSIFNSLAALIITGYNISTSRVASWNVAYNYWAVIALDAFSIVFWIANLGVVGMIRAGASFGEAIFDLGSAFTGEDILPKSWKTYVDSLSAAAAFSAFQAVLFIVSLAVTAVYVHRYRKGRTATSGELEKAEGGYALGVIPPQQQQLPGQGEIKQVPAQVQQVLA